MSFSGRPSAALDRIADGFDYAIIGPHDDRTRVARTSAPPYAAICHIERDFGDGRLSGCTGFLVAPRFVVTAGHCVFSLPRRLLTGDGRPARIRVTPGRDGARTPFGAQWARRWSAHRRFVENRDAQYDFALIELASPFPRVAPMPLATLDDAALETVRAARLLHIAGFPADKQRGTMWEHAERLDRVTPRALYYSVDTCPGHSGSPIWTLRGRGGGVEAIGVHVAGPKPHEHGAWGCRPGAPTAPAGAVNRGVRLTPDLAAIVRRLEQGAETAATIAFSPRGPQ